jgi:uncharacterized protein YndB with AHSA1/START domain
VSRNLHFEATYPHPIERVWAAITTPEAIAEWLMANDFAPVLGHRFQFRSQPQPGWNGIVDCEVTALEPPTLLAYSWRGSSLDTVLTIRLREVPGGTHLTLDHTGFRGVFATFVSYMMGSGWKGIVGTGIANVLDKLERGEPLSGEPGCAKTARR